MTLKEKTFKNIYGEKEKMLITIGLSKNKMVVETIAQYCISVGLFFDRCKFFSLYCRYVKKSPVMSVEQAV